MLPNIDHPETFGQHPNADIASQIIETRFVIFRECVIDFTPSSFLYKLYKSVQCSSELFISACVYLYCFVLFVLIVRIVR